MTSNDNLMVFYLIIASIMRNREFLGKQEIASTRFAGLALI
ncbi:MAG: hypothetical protein MHPDNHAH_01736 [Anaerolineales bacterium]|nr:hypothetical protein [Anaerolineales bacterium]